MQTVIETEAYLKDAKRAGLSEQERMAIVEYLAGHPEAGDEIQGTGGARKVRFAGQGKGKRGGYRVITFSVERIFRCFSSTCLRRMNGST